MHLRRSSSSQTIHYLHRTKTIPLPLFSFRREQREGSTSHPRCASAQNERDGNALTPALYPHTTPPTPSPFFLSSPPYFVFPPPQSEKIFIPFSFLFVIISLEFASLFFLQVPSFPTIDFTTYYTGHDLRENVRISLANMNNIECLHFQIFSRFLRQDYGLRFKNERKLRDFLSFPFFTVH